MNMPIAVKRDDVADIVPVVLDCHYSTEPLTADKEKALFLERLKMQEQKLAAVLKIPSALKLIKNHYHRLTTQEQNESLFIVRGEVNSLNGFSQKAKKNKKVQSEHAGLIVDLCDQLLALQDRAYTSTDSALEANVAQTDAPRRFLLETMMGAYPFRSFWDQMSKHMDSVGRNRGKYNPALRSDFELAALDFYAATKREKQIEHTVAQSNTRWVYDQLKTISRDPVVQAGFLSDGMEGYYKAIERFDVTLGYRFNTYATAYVRSFINEAVNNEASVIPMTLKQSKLVQCAEYLTRHYELEHGRKPDPHTLSGLFKKAGYKVSARTVAEMDTYGRVEGSLNAMRELGKEPAYDFEDTRAFGSPEAILEARENSRLHKEAFASLSGRQRRILSLRVGLFGTGDQRREHTQREIAPMEKLTASRIQQIEREAILKLRDYVRNKHQTNFDLG